MFVTFAIVFLVILLAGGIVVIVYGLARAVRAAPVEAISDEELARLGDTDILPWLKRVVSDLDFRGWLKRTLRILVALVIFDLLLSSATVVAIVGVRVALNRIEAVQTQTDHQQIEQDKAAKVACERDNTFRAAYVNQWQPILSQPAPPLPDDATDAQKQMFDAQQHTRDAFQHSLDTDFAQHPC